MAGSFKSQSRERKDGTWARILCISGLIAAVAIAFTLVNTYFVFEPDHSDYDQCCDYPCRNQGVCMTLENDKYACDCTGTGYKGALCNVPEIGTWFGNLITPGMETMHQILTSFDWLWDIVNSNDFLRDYASVYLYLMLSDFSDSPPAYVSNHNFVSINANHNYSQYGRSLPPVPGHCPTAMGTKGPKNLPSIDVLMKNIFTRKEFILDPHHSNAMFQYYAHHFSKQFIHDEDKGPEVIHGRGEMDLSHIYGKNERERQMLRSGTNGKLHNQIINGEEFPPFWEDISNTFASHKLTNRTFALPHSSFSVVPGLFVLSTIWLREHNRVCDELLKVHSDWNDDQIYETARLIVTGEFAKITIEEYLQQVSQYKLELTFKPNMLHETRFQFHNRIHAEFNHLFEWLPFISEDLQVKEDGAGSSEIPQSLEPVFEEGLDAFVHSMVDTQAGALTAENHGPSVYPFLKEALEVSRQLRFQGINAYRERLGLEVFSSFEDLSGEKEIAAILKEMYDDIDAVEYYVGLLVEQSGSSIAGLTMSNLASIWTVRSVFSNPICSQMYWKPSTFGGEVGWNIIQNASLSSLFCHNMKSCRHISFSVPL